MRSVVALVLIECLLTATVPVRAQEVSPFTRAVAREAGRLAATGDFRPSAGHAPGRGGEPADDNWSRVLKLAAGTGIVVTVQGSAPADRYYVSGDDSGLTVLNVGATALPSAARDVLRDVASTHPEYFSAAQKGRQIRLEKQVRLGPDGVFVADRNVAALVDVVEHFSRDTIAEIQTAPVDSNPVGCAVAGYYGGALIGGLPGALIGGAAGNDTGPALAGMMVGWSLGSLYVYRKCRHKPERVIYP
jgi:hypothetical protein